MKPTDSTITETSLAKAISFIEKSQLPQFRKKFIIQRLVEQSSSTNRITNISNSKIVGELIKSENLGHIVINLYPNNDGYSIGIRPPRDSISMEINGISALNTVKLSYEDDDLLDYIDNEELPPVIADLIESICGHAEQSRLFYCGCVTAEIRDYRTSASIAQECCETHFVLLKPTNQTVMNDVNNLTSGNCSSSTKQTWTEDEKIALETGIVNATAEPLCLDPSPLVGIMSTNLEYQKNWLKASHKIRR